MNELLELSIGELCVAYRSGAVSPVDVTAAALERIEQTNFLLCSFNTVVAESAMARARAAEKEFAAGHDLGPMHGVPFGAKDIYDSRAGCVVRYCGNEADVRAGQSTWRWFSELVPPMSVPRIGGRDVHRLAEMIVAVEREY